MVTEYGSEEEQVEAIKKWLRSHGPSIIAGIVIGLALIGGWRFWTSYQLSQAESASQGYEALTATVADNDLAETRTAAPALKDDYPDSAYAPLAALQLAKLAVEQNDNATAISELEWAVANAKDPNIASAPGARAAGGKPLRGRQSPFEQRHRRQFHRRRRGA